MPQMMPINWIILFFMFIMTFIIFNILNYFIFFKKKNNMNLYKNKIKIFNWKW